MVIIYNVIDRIDKYIYEREYVEVYNFGLELQIKYFKLGNDVIIEKFDDLNLLLVKNIVDINIEILINNMINYLDEINNEKLYINFGLDLIVNGIDKNFIELVNIYLNYNFSGLFEKVNFMFKKIKLENIK